VFQSLIKVKKASERLIRPRRSRIAAPVMAMAASFHRKGRVMMPTSVNTPTKEASSVFQNSGIGKYWNTVVVPLSFRGQ
jgi:hypothetical protein